MTNLKGELLPGAVLGAYRVVSLIERGGMGAVYEVEDRFGDHYAMKLPDWRIQQEEPRLRFARRWRR